MREWGTATTELAPGVFSYVQATGGFCIANAGIIDGGNVKSWIAVFDGLRRFGNATFVPGHGRPAKLAAFEFPTREYLATLHAHMKKMAEAGVDMSDAIAQLDQSRFSKLANYEDLAKRNANVAYREAEADSFK